MLKKMLSIALVVSILGILPLLAGCEQNEYKSTRSSETKTTEVHEVVE